MYEQRKKPRRGNESGAKVGPGDRPHQRLVSDCLFSHPNLINSPSNVSPWLLQLELHTATTRNAQTSIITT
jgi:hypothetical protein